MSKFYGDFRKKCFNMEGIGILAVWPHLLLRLTRRHVKNYFSNNAINDLKIMFKDDFDQNEIFKKLLGPSVNPFSAEDELTRFDPQKWPYQQNDQI